MGRFLEWWFGKYDSTERRLSISFRLRREAKRLID